MLVEIGPVLFGDIEAGIQCAYTVSLICCIDYAGDHIQCLHCLARGMLAVYSKEIDG